jgi:membrane protein implicated in regulation of membrane protease activity
MLLYVWPSWNPTACDVLAWQHHIATHCATLRVLPVLVYAGVLLLAIAVALLLVGRRRRRNRRMLQLSQQHLHGSKHGAEIVVTAGDVGTVTDTDTHSDRGLQATMLFR